ncbi:MAG TPA: CAP domain-containing protein [Candidatus Limnocylindrales bacterium]|nr:CAP domain-containing protein [Candidatus Limnocylindrales bacterium]
MQKVGVGTRLFRALVALPFLTAALFLAAPASLADADVVSATAMMQLHNEMRFAIGAPTIPMNPSVVLAAQNHANYNSANRITGHYETAGLPYYTGYGPRDRVIAAGLTTSFVSEVATGGGSGALAGVRQLWDAPYHRLGMMHPSASSAGWGHSDLAGSATVADITYDFGIRSTNFVRSPAAGQTGIAASWSGNESPSPLPAGVSGPVGYPIMLVYSGGQRVDMRAAEIVAPGGSRVPIYYAPQQFEYDYQVIIPQRPLAAGTTYHVRFDINVNSVMVTNEWDFTTAGTGTGTTPPPPPPPATLTYHSGFIDQSLWPTLAPGAMTQLQVRFRNTGTATWMKGVPNAQANLGINGDNQTFAALGMSVNWLANDRPAAQSEATVPPGGTATFVFTIRAPQAPGSYRIPLRPVIDGRTWMEDQGVFLVVTSDLGYHSHWSSQSDYPTVRPGAITAPLFVKFQNTGTRAWIKGATGQQANLGVVNDNNMWSGLGVGWLTPNRVAAQSETIVNPGGVGTFSFQLRAPSTPGVYRIAVRPVIDGTTWMEHDGVFLVITVTN